MNDRLLTKYEVMETLKISRKHFEKLVKEKELPMIPKTIKAAAIIMKKISIR